VYLLPEEFAVTLTPEHVTPITPGRWRSEVTRTDRQRKIVQRVDLRRHFAWDRGL